MPQTRLGDILAVNTQTGEIRRFVDVTEPEVRDDLQGVRQIPNQVELAAFWGDRTPTGQREQARELLRQRILGPGHRVLIANLVQEARFSLYGPVNNPLELTLQGTGWDSGGNEGIGSVNLQFVSPLYPGASCHLDLTCARARQPGIYYPPEDDAEGARRLDESLFFMFFGLDNEAKREEAGEPTTWRGEVLIDGETFSGIVRSWSQPEQIARFRFTHEDIVLSGHNRGPALDEILELIQNLTAINQRADLLTQYQREADAALEKLFAH